MSDGLADRLAGMDARHRHARLGSGRCAANRECFTPATAAWPVRWLCGQGRGNPFPLVTGRPDRLSECQSACYHSKPHQTFRRVYHHRAARYRATRSTRRYEPTQVSGQGSALGVSWTCPSTKGVAMSDEMGGIRQKADEIASESVEKAAEIVEVPSRRSGAMSRRRGQHSQGGRRNRHRCDRKGHWNCGRRPWQGEEADETETESETETETE